MRHSVWAGDTGGFDPRVSDQLPWVSFLEEGSVLQAGEEVFDSTHPDYRTRVWKVSRLPYKEYQLGALPGRSTGL